MNYIFRPGRHWESLRRFLTPLASFKKVALWRGGDGDENLRKGIQTGKGVRDRKRRKSRGGAVGLTDARLEHGRWLAETGQYFQCFLSVI